MSKKVVGIIIAVILVGGVLGWFFMQRETAAPEFVEDQKQDIAVVPEPVTSAPKETINPVVTPPPAPKPVTPPPAQPRPVPTPVPPVITPPPVGPKTYTLAEVSTHKDSTSCWSAISGTVYDLTAWITKHPGGAANILSICGKDGTSSFTGQHEGEPKPANILAGYEIGILK